MVFYMPGPAEPLAPSGADLLPREIVSELDRFIVGQDAAVMLLESQLDTAFEKTFGDLVSDPERMKHLGENIKGLARPNATRDIVDEIERLLEKTYGTR